MYTQAKPSHVGMHAEAVTYDICNRRGLDLDWPVPYPETRVAEDLFACEVNEHPAASPTLLSLTGSQRAGPVKNTGQSAGRLSAKSHTGLWRALRPSSMWR